MSLQSIFLSSLSTRLRHQQARPIVHARSFAVGRLAVLFVFLSAFGCTGDLSSLRTAIRIPPAKPTDPSTSGHLPPDKILAPSNYRDWIPSQALLPYAEINGDEAKIFK